MDLIDKVDKPTAKIVKMPFTPSDWLQFLDGSSLHGSLNSVDIEKGVHWQHPAAKQVIEFKPANLAGIRFEHSKPVTLPGKPTCRFRFANDDEVFGNFISLDGETIELETWFGGKLKAPRQTVKSIAFLAKGFSVLYEGPTGLEDWKLGRAPNNWHYRDGAFIANGPGSLGRDMKLTNSVSLEFDLGWSGKFYLIIVLYAEVMDQLDYNSSSYMFYLGPGYLNVQRVQARAGVASMGQVQIPSMLKKNEAHLEFRANKEDATLAVLVDGVLVQRWKDNNGFAAKGSGIVFFSQTEDALTRVSNLKITEWDGKFDPDATANVSGKEDQVSLVNRDKVSGSVQSFRDGKLTMATALTKLDIPLQRVTQIVLGGEGESAKPASPWLIRAFLNGGGIISFQLDKWNETQVTGTSPNFGRTAFNPQSIKQIQFNLDRLKTMAETSALAGEDRWEVEE